MPPLRNAFDRPSNPGTIKTTGRANSPPVVFVEMRRVFNAVTVKSNYWHGISRASLRKGTSPVRFSATITAGITIS